MNEIDMRESFAKLLSQVFINISKWLLGLNGAGIALAFAFIISNYTAIPQTKDCQSIAFISDSIKGGAFFVRVFSLGIAFSIFAIVIPAAIGLIRNILMYNKSNNVKHGDIVQIEKEFEGYDAAAIFGAVFWQFVATIASAIMFLLSFITIINYSGKETPQALMKTWTDFSKIDCSAQPK